MKIENGNTDSAILEELGKRLTQARLERNLTQEGFADATGISKRTVERLETGHSVQLTNLIRVLRGLDLARNLDQLVPAAGPGPLEQLKLQGRERRRASSHKAPPTARGDWTWADNK